MASYNFGIFSKVIRKRGAYPISLKIAKNKERKFLETGLKAEPEQWNKDTQRFVQDKKVVPNFKELNLRLSELEVKLNKIVRDFEITETDWTLNQFEEAFLNKSAKGNVKEYVEKLVATLRESGHIGNANVYKRTLHMLELNDKKFKQRTFPEIDLKYVKDFDLFMQKRECKGNTRKYYMQTLRSVLNRAIEDKVANDRTYPFGRNGFKVAKLKETTLKRYMPLEKMEKLKKREITKEVHERTRKLFLFLYYCFGISFMDAAYLKKKNIIEGNNCKYIIYKRRKTNEAQESRFIQVRITDELQDLLDWFAKNALLIDDYILPIISKPGYEGEKLYNHILCRYRNIRKSLSKIPELLGLGDINLTTYVSRHTMAMTLQDNLIPREVISQIMGHKDMATTNTYLDSFESKVIDDAAKVL